MRRILPVEQIEANADGILRVFVRYIDYGDGPQGALRPNNAAWLDELRYIDFLRDIGRHFTINRMLAFESVKSRLDREQALSFIEFNYMLLQSYDFLELNRRHGCVLQMGGSDQWGNIVSGADLIRRVEGARGVRPDHAAGDAGGRQEDGQVGRGRGLAERGHDVVLRVLAVVAKRGGCRRRQVPEDVHRAAGRRMRAAGRAWAGRRSTRPRSVLADEVTALCRGRAAAEAAEATAREVFEKGGVGEDLPMLALSAEEVGDGISVVQLIMRSGLAKSGKEAKRLIAGHGARLDDVPLTDAGLMLDRAALASPVKLSAGRKRHALVTLTS